MVSTLYVPVLTGRKQKTGEVAARFSTWKAKANSGMTHASQVSTTIGIAA